MTLLHGLSKSPCFLCISDHSRPQPFDGYPIGKFRLQHRIWSVPKVLAFWLSSIPNNFATTFTNVNVNTQSQQNAGLKRWTTTFHHECSSSAQDGESLFDRRFVDPCWARTFKIKRQRWLNPWNLKTYPIFTGLYERHHPTVNDFHPTRSLTSRVHVAQVVWKFVWILPGYRRLPHDLCHSLELCSNTRCMHMGFRPSKRTWPRVRTQAG